MSVPAPAPGGDAADPENTCEMVVNAAIAPGTEVFNTYGAKLSNAELLVRYGFILDANDNDTLTWTIDEIWDAAGATLYDLLPRRWDDHASYGACMEILRDWQYDAGWADSELVIDTEPSENITPLYVTAEGVLSHKLWSAIAVATLWRQGTTTEVTQMCHLLTRMARGQIQLEQGQTGSGKGGVNEDDEAYEVRGHAAMLLARRPADIENGKIKLCVHNQLLQYTLRWFTTVWNRSFGAKTCVHLPSAFGDAESAGVGQAGSHDRGIVRAEVGSDFPPERTTTGRSRSWPT